ncbi:MAG: hydroxymethylbilane synthase [Planctomycetes bacterium]|nr:hydroxymethylbilane synthase [Planctomycetota bacterium]
MADTLRIGTRGSRLALWQAEFVAERLRAAHPGLEVSVETYRTTGDRDRATPLARLPGVGFFVKELEQALLEGAIDLAVHSLKDVPTRVPDGLAVGAAVPERDDARDCLVTPAGLALEELPEGAVVGTSSPRRRAMLAALAASRYGSRRDPAVGQAGRPDLAFVDLRGNVETRLRKLADGVCDATVLAAAGLVRLGSMDARAVPLKPEVVLPAAGQGALGLEHRADDAPVRRRITALDHEPSRRAVVAERAVLARLEAGCRTPIGVLGRVEADGRLHLEAWLLAPDGSRGIRRGETSAGDAAEAGVRLAEAMLADGAADLMRLEA